MPVQKMMSVGPRTNWRLIWTISKTPEQAIRRLWNQGYRGEWLKPPRDWKAHA